MLVLVLLVLEIVDELDGIVLVTGDHGESIHDDGTLSHGSRLSEIQTLVPMFMVGRNIPEQVIHSVTSHVDVIPTIADAIGVSYTSTAGKHGSSWLSQNAVSHAQLLVHEYPDSWDVAIIDGSLSESGEKLMLNIDRTDGACRILGFAGSDGLINPSFRKSPSDAKRWANRFLSAIAALETDHP